MDQQNEIQQQIDIVTNVSHEIRTPLHAMMGFSQLLLQTELTEVQREYVTQIDTSSRHLLKLVNAILDIAKLDAGKMKVEKIPFFLDEVMDQSIHMVALQAQSKGIEVLSSLGQAVPLGLIGDPLRLGQILINLMHNAVKFTEKGYVLLSVEAVRLRESTGELRFSVQDTGIGMDALQVKNLFQHFVQGDDSIVRRYGGTGLGLSISAKLVELMGGKLSVQSDIGIGTTFSFTLEFPLSPMHEVAKMVPHVDVDATCVIIVAIDSLERKLLAQQIRNYGFSTLVVDSIAACVPQTANQEQQSNDLLLIIDHETLSWSDFLFDNPKIPALILRTSRESADCDVVGQRGREHTVILRKPISPIMIIDKLCRLLQRSTTLAYPSTLQQVATSLVTTKEIALDTKQALLRLRKEIATHAFRAQDTMASLMQSTSLSELETFKHLKERIDQFDYDQAQQILDDLFRSL
nr:hypothetical protein [Bacilli bacterium]